ncbi:hypothetical protein ALP27_200075 [Pseudomonas savastanoi pv. glycinea]|nr:hypothetical protein ALP27_200075 [Pseudomonas savastanoi pv. glycinea]
MYDSAFFQFVILHVPLNGIKLSNGVAQRRASCKEYTSTVVLLLQVPTFNKQVEGLFGTSEVPQTGNSAQRRGNKQVLEFLSLINNECVDAQICKGHCLVFSTCIGFFLQAFLHPLFGLLHFLDGDAVPAVVLEIDDCITQVANLFLEQFFKGVLRHPDFFKRTMSYHDSIPITRCDTGKQALAVFLFEV